MFDNLTIQPPPNTLRLQTVDMHTGGEPLRIITGGLPSIPGDNVLEKLQFFRRNFDQIRTGLIFEPRGHADMYGAVLSRGSDGADFDVFFLHNEGYSTMCGHAIIALTKFVIEAGLMQGVTVSFNVPAGRIEARGVYGNGVIEECAFLNVPSFVLKRDQQVSVPGLGSIHVDVCYGGAFYAVLNVQEAALRVAPEYHDQLIAMGRRIKRAVVDQCVIEHPFEPALSFLYGTIFTDSAQAPYNHSSNACVFADGELDRSATGSGVSARAALHFTKGELPLGQAISIESIIGTTMDVRVSAVTEYGPYPAVIPEVRGRAYYCGRNEFWFDPSDPLIAGFLLR
jgi:proline racemase